VTSSSEFHDDRALVAAALEGLRDENVMVVATTPAMDPRSFAIPPNARVLRYAAHGPLLPRAVCVVSHGGMGITQKALAAGVPVCVVPFGRDQLEVARRVERCGAGVWLRRRALDPERLRDSVRAAAANRAGALRVAAAFRTAGGATAAADAVETTPSLTGLPADARAPSRMAQELNE